MDKLHVGSPMPCGSLYDGNGINFAIYAKHANKVELCLFDSQGQETRLPLPSKTNDIWHGYLANITLPIIYGYRVYGENKPQDNIYFYPQKLLLDPYAKHVIGSAIDHSSLYINDLDSAQHAPKSMVIDEFFDWQDDKFPNTDWGQTIIYELHVKGFSKLNTQLPESIRGTYAALDHPIIIDYLTDLGITAVELLPIQKHIDEPRLQHLSLNNYWGYNVLAPFALENKYWSQQPSSTPETEFKTAVKNLHQAGIEVILDVVFNHTAELDNQGPILSLKGIDSANYYWYNQNELANWTGCGNTLKFEQQNIIQWVVDCLCHWRENYHIDGFRFDLGSILARTPDFDAEAALLKAITSHPTLANCKLIMEPWDIGPNGYQLGRFNSPFAEWNDHYRDGMRQFWLQKNQTLAQFVQYFSGSAESFNPHQRLPYSIINFITCHDGFTLHDLVCFKQKHNQLNQENNRDGCDNNHSQNFGYEGLINPNITNINIDNQALTTQQLTTIENTRLVVRQSLLTTLLLSLGTPMLLAGDEFGNSQLGNNNSYCQDNAIGWLDWQHFDRPLFNHVKNLIKLRKNIPSLVSDQWLTDLDVQWLNSQAEPLQSFEWHSDWIKAMQILLSGYLLLLINGSESTVDFILPKQKFIPITSINLIQTDYHHQNQTTNSNYRWRCEPNQIQIFYLTEDENYERDIRL